MWKNSKPPKGSHYLPTGLEKVANSVTHLPWIPAGFYFASNLIKKSKAPTELIVASIYGFALISLFVASSAYHCCTLLSTKSRYHDFLHYLDRLVIFLFIASSYTPWLVLREYEMDVGLFTLRIIWMISIFGGVYQYFYRERWKLLSLFFYLSVGVLPAVSVAYVKDSTGMRNVALGGITYIVGTFFYRKDGVIPMAHAIWHCFVSLAAFIHFTAVDQFLYSP